MPRDRHKAQHITSGKLPAARVPFNNATINQDGSGDLEFDSLPAEKLVGALPALDGSDLTNLPVPTNMASTAAANAFTEPQTVRKTDGTDASAAAAHLKLENLSTAAATGTGISFVVGDTAGASGEAGAIYGVKEGAWTSSDSTTKDGKLSLRVAVNGSLIEKAVLASDGNFTAVTFTGAGTGLTGVAKTGSANTYNALQTINTNVNSPTQANLRLENASTNNSIGVGVEFAVGINGGGGTLGVAGAIFGAKEGQFNTTTANQDGRLSFRVAVDGVLTERATLSSAGVFTATSFSGAGTALTGVGRLANANAFLANNTFAVSSATISMPVQVINLNAAAAAEVGFPMYLGENTGAQVTTVYGMVKLSKTQDWLVTDTTTRTAAMHFMVPNGNSMATGFIIAPSGNVMYGQTVDDNTNKVQITGNVKFTGDLLVTEDITATGSFNGPATGLTGIPAANLTGALPAISGAALTNLPSSAYDFNGGVDGKPAASAKIAIIPVVRTVNFAAGFAGGVAHSEVQANNEAIFTIERKRSGNTAIIGYVTFAASATTGSFTSSGNSAYDVVSGDILYLVAPTSQDSTLADVSITLKGTL